MPILFKDKEDNNEKNENKVLILTVFATVDYYFIEQYKKIQYKTLSLSGNSYIMELLLQNHLQRI